jgi:hypothetical protein
LRCAISVEPSNSAVCAAGLGDLLAVVSAAAQRVPATDRRSRLAEPQRPHVASTVHDAHDDDFGVGEAVVQRVVAMEVYAQACGQLILTWSDLRMVLDGLEARLDLPNQLRCRRAVVTGDEAPDLDQILFGALG